MGALLIVTVLSGCRVWFPAPERAPGHGTAALQPTLDLDAIPVLGEADPAPPVPLFADDPHFPIQPAAGERYVMGRALYEAHCASCHGLAGEGQGPEPLAPGAAPPHNADGHTWHHPDQQNFATVWQGREVAGALMPGYHDRLKPDEIVAVLAYIKTWWLPDQLARQLAQTEQVIAGLADGQG